MFWPIKQIYSIEFYSGIEWEGNGRNGKIQKGIVGMETTSG
jgi:hypothetical protein